MIREPFITNSRLRPSLLKPRKAPLQRSTKPIRARRPNNAASRRPGMSPAHLAMIRQLPCCITGKPGPNDPHHIKSGPARLERGVGIKATDQWAIPISREMHEEVERAGSRNELQWFKERGIANVVSLAADLWEARGDIEKMRRVLFKHMRQIAGAE